MKNIILTPPHGGKLNPLYINEKNERESILKEAESFKKISLESKEISDIFMLGSGSYSPIKGFMCKYDYLDVLEHMSLKDGTVWPIPITLSVNKKEAKKLKEGQSITLYDCDLNKILAVMEIEDIYLNDKNKEALSIFKTIDEEHPGVRKLLSQGDFNIGGKVKVLDYGAYINKFEELAFPELTRNIFAEKGWQTIVAFQTRNPMHRSHEYLTKIALEIYDGLFINPIVGELKKGDIPAQVRMECYKALIKNYYPKERVVLKTYPMEMRYAGPKEAILHAIIRQNFGCSHIIIGRDHAGVGNYYKPFEAQEIFDEVELLIKPLKLDWTFWCYKCDSMASLKTCSHHNEDRLFISGTELRKLLSNNDDIPEKFSRNEVLMILRDYYLKGKTNK